MSIFPWCIKKGIRDWGSGPVYEVKPLYIEPGSPWENPVSATISLVFVSNVHLELFDRYL